MRINGDQNKSDNQTEHSPLACPGNVSNRPSPIPCDKAHACTREDPATGGVRVAPISANLWWIPYIPEAKDESGLEVKEASNMVEKLRREGFRRKRNMRDSTEKNGAAKQGHTEDEKKKGWLHGCGRRQKVRCVAAAGVVPSPLVRHKPTVFLQVNTRRDLLDCESYNA